MTLVYLMTKNDIPITRIFYNKHNVRMECRNKNACSDDGIKYSYKIVIIADS